MIVNAGNRVPSLNAPVDWNYHPLKIEALYEEDPQQDELLRHPYRAASSWAKLIQLYHTGPGGVLMDDAYARWGHPGRWGDFLVLADIDAYTRAALFSTLLSAYMDAVEAREPVEWDRPEDINTPNRWEPASYRPVKITSGSWTAAHNDGRYADLFYTVIPAFREWGVDAGVLDRMIDWGAEMWPLADWEALRGPQAVIGEGDGLVGTYFTDMTLSTQDFTRTDSVVDFSWKPKTGPGGILGHNFFSARWTGYVLPKFSGPITFHVRSDDGARLWIDGQLLVDQWVTTGRVVEGEGTITLEAGVPVSITLEYFEERVDAEVELAWSSAYNERAVIPQSQLYTTPPSAPTATEGEAPVAFELEAGYPNPFRTATTLAYTVPAAGPVRLEVYDLLGRRVAVLVDETVEAGRHAASLSAEGLASGAYVVRLVAGDRVETRRVTVVR